MLGPTTKKRKGNVSKQNTITNSEIAKHLLHHTMTSKIPVNPTTSQKSLKSHMPRQLGYFQSSSFACNGNIIYTS